MKKGVSIPSSNLSQNSNWMSGEGRRPAWSVCAHWNLVALWRLYQIKIILNYVNLVSVLPLVHLLFFFFKHKPLLSYYPTTLAVCTNDYIIFRNVENFKDFPWNKKFVKENIEPSRMFYLFEMKISKLI
jgi:hypothetical protein